MVFVTSMRYTIIWNKTPKETKLIIRQNSHKELISTIYTLQFKSCFPSSSTWSLFASSNNLKINNAYLKVVIDSSTSSFVQKWIENIFTFIVCFCSMRLTSLQLSFLQNKHHVDRTWLRFTSCRFGTRSNFVSIEDFQRVCNSFIIVNLICIPQCNCCNYKLIFLHNDCIMQHLSKLYRGIL